MMFFWFIDFFGLFLWELLFIDYIVLKPIKTVSILFLKQHSVEMFIESVRNKKNYKSYEN